MPLINPAASGKSLGAKLRRMAIAALGDPLTFFIPIASDSPSWVSGTGKISSTTGTGNSDVYTSSDGIHPDQMGIDYKATKLEAAFRQLVLSSAVLDQIAA